MTDPTILTFLPYLLGASALLLVAALRNWRVHDSQIDNVAVALFMLCSAIVAGTMELGTDQSGYRDTYNDISSYPGYLGWWEPGYEYAARLFVALGASYGLFTFVCVLLSHGIKLYVFTKSSSNVALAFFVLFCFNLGEVAFVRQYLAASLVFLAFYQFTQRRFLLAVLSMVLATLVHKTALLAGGLVLFAYFGARAFFPLILLAGTIAISAVVLPASITQGIGDRIIRQVAVYTAAGYVQGLDAEDVALARNLLKFAFYVILVFGMLWASRGEAINKVQRQSARVVLVLSAVSFLLIILVSPVFSRLSTYIFPFIALAARPEMFRPRFYQLPVQFAATALLIINMLVAIYPLASAF